MPCDLRLICSKLKEMLTEDIGFGDITTHALIPEDTIARAQISTNEAGTIAGLEEVKLLFEQLGVRVDLCIKDGDTVASGQNIMELRGHARSILIAERIALNLLMRMSGIATITSKAVRKAKAINFRIIVAGTRKTMPLLRYFDKKAIELGGGDPHRWRLDDHVMIKDNHLALVGEVNQAVVRAKEVVSFSKKIEVEIQRPQDALEAVRAGADILLLDNMSLEAVSTTLKLLTTKGLRDEVLVEASGGINLENLEEYAKTGVDIISMGCLTHSVKALDLKLEIIGIC